jgi:hypothetical protein
MDDKGTREHSPPRPPPRRRRFLNNSVCCDVAKQSAHEILDVVWTMRTAGQRADEAGVVWDYTTVRGLVRSRGVRGRLGDGCREVSDGVSRRAVREIPGGSDDGRVVRGVRRREGSDEM